MSILEIDRPTRPRRADLPAREVAITVTPAMLGLSSRPEFLSVEAGAVVATDRPTLWDALRLSWTEPRAMRDLLGDRSVGRAAGAVSVPLGETG